MTSIRPFLFLALSAVTLSCASKPAPDTTPPITEDADEVAISIAAVTLADDCGTGPTAAPITQAEAAPPAQGEMAKRSSMSINDMSAGARACQQSSIQLRVANGTAEAAKVVIQKVELLDDSGQPIGELTAREPSQWAGDTYQPWDEQVAPDGELQVSYALSAPLVQRGATYTVRVTVSTVDGQRMLEQETTLEAEGSLPPGAVT
jgi:hypothetical protein